VNSKRVLFLSDDELDLLARWYELVDDEGTLNFPDDEDLELLEKIQAAKPD
jgi:hypothetical protein